jgi:iron complex transport system substrate-binding protein
LTKYLHKKDDDGLQKRRVASFLPSSTEILYELELADQIVGVTHECNYPEEAKTKPNLINSSFDTATYKALISVKK